MAKIESIRPGGTLEASLATYPLAELLLGILRGNLTGRLDLFLHPEPRNLVVFKDGVPVSVQLPDAGVSLVKILIDSAEIPHDRGLDLLRVAEASGRTEEAVIQQHNVLTAGALDEARRRRARAQMVRLFDAGALDFRFTEGTGMSADMPLTILQPLPIVFEGLHRARDRSVVTRFLEAHGRSIFKLSGTYPRGVDPFEWGAQVERAVLQISVSSMSQARLQQAGLHRDVASVVLTSLFLADMLDLVEQGPGLRPAPSSGAMLQEPRQPAFPPPVTPPPAAPPPPPVTPPPAARRVSATPPRGAAPPGGGLLIHRRSGGQQSVQNAKDSTPPAGGLPVVRGTPSSGVRPPAPPPPPPVSGGQPGSHHDQEMAAVRKRIAPIAGQTYYQLLRVTPGSTPEQVERAYRFLMRRIEDEADDPGWRATKDLLQEAFTVLGHPIAAERYAQMVERAEKSPAGFKERLAFEAEPKIGRALGAMAEGRTGEAAFLLLWAEKLDSSRIDIPVLQTVLDYLRAPPNLRAEDAKAMNTFVAREVARQPHDWRLKLCHALVLAELGDKRTAQAMLTDCPEANHPMARLVHSKL